mmetsp:Transcript_93108/g.262473  ORF Transcript_93108/g.262473 Transcript_93108/m.262473 type:complete len:81 (-) Transcript_93108:712-954(-)
MCWQNEFGDLRRRVRGEVHGSGHHAHLYVKLGIARHPSNLRLLHNHNDLLYDHDHEDHNIIHGDYLDDEHLIGIHDDEFH